MMDHGLAGERPADCPGDVVAACGEDSDEALAALGEEAEAEAGDGEVRVSCTSPSGGDGGGVGSLCATAAAVSLRCAVLLGGASRAE